MNKKDQREALVGVICLLIVMALFLLATVMCPMARGQYLDVPEAFRQENYRRTGPLGIVGSSYSCVHASTATMLRWSNMEKRADQWIDEYYGGETLSSLTWKLDQTNLKYAICEDSSTDWLELAIHNRLVVGLGGSPYRRHALNLVGLTKSSAFFINNLTHGTRLERASKQEFYKDFKESGAWAWVFCYVPPPPRPTNLLVFTGE